MVTPLKDEQVKIVADFVNDIGELITTLEIPDRHKICMEITYISNEIQKKF